MSDKRGWFLFGAKPAQSEAPDRAARLSGVHPNNGGVEEKKRSRLEVEGLFLGLDKREAEGTKPGRCAVSVPCATSRYAPKWAFSHLLAGASVRAYLGGKCLILIWLPPRDSNPDMLIQSQLTLALW